jgi:hypothetical protein
VNVGLLIGAVPRFVSADAEDVAPVPPFAIARVPPIPDRVTVAHVGAVEAPAEVTTWPAVNPAGLTSWIGVSVAPNPSEANAKSAAAKSRFVSRSPIRIVGRRAADSAQV